MYRCVINLDQSTDRWSALQPQFDRLGLEVERLSAVLGRALPEEELQRWCAPSGFGYLYPLTPGEVGCFLSHRKAWTRFLETDEVWCAVFEDDIVLAEELGEYMSAHDWIPEGVDVVKFNAPGDTILIDRKILKTSKGTDLVRQIRPVSFRTEGYLINRAAAQSALAMTTRFNCPVDYFMFSPWFPFIHKHPAWRLGINLVRLSGAPSGIGLRKRKGGLKEDLTARWNPLRWAKQIAISAEKLGKTHYSVKSGTFE